MAFVFTPHLAIPFDVEPRNALVSAFVLIVVVCVSIFAALMPARRAARVDPIVALRHE